MQFIHIKFTEFFIILINLFQLDIEIESIKIIFIYIFSFVSSFSIALKQWKINNDFHYRASRVRQTFYPLSMYNVYTHISKKKNVYSEAKTKAKTVWRSKRSNVYTIIQKTSSCIFGKKKIIRWDVIWNTIFIGTHARFQTHFFHKLNLYYQSNMNISTLYKYCYNLN